ncbi:MAG: hypothetical protein WC763_04645 [Candidatus Paceibacterota bacterium]|jgi:hypothetical protein
MPIRNIYTDPQIRAWLQVRAEAFTPRIKRTKKTKAAPYAFTLEALAADMRRTLKELEERIAKAK